MLGICDIGVSVPSAFLDVQTLADQFEADSGFIEEKLGFRTLSRISERDDCSHMCCDAYQDLEGRHPIDVTSVDCVVVVTQNPDAGGIPHTSAIVHRELGLDSRTACFDVSLGCTGFVHSLSVVCGFLRENGLKRGLLFTADPYSKIVSPADRDTALLFGDAATCTLISDDATFCIGKTSFLTDSSVSDAIRVQSRGGHLAMDGNQVFRFVAKHVPPQILQCIQDNGLTIDQVDAFLLHQGSKYIVDTIANKLNIPVELVPFGVRNTGNTVSSTLPFLLQRYIQSENEVNTILLSGFGVGLSAASTILTRQSR